MCPDHVNRISDWHYQLSIKLHFNYFEFSFNYNFIESCPLGRIHINIGSDNGLVPSGNKPSPAPMLTQVICILGSLRPNELMYYFLHDVEYCMFVQGPVKLMGSTSKGLYFNSLPCGCGRYGHNLRCVNLNYTFEWFISWTFPVKVNTGNHLCEDQRPHWW